MKILKTKGFDQYDDIFLDNSHPFSWEISDPEQYAGIMSELSNINLSNEHFCIDIDTDGDEITSERYSWKYNSVIQIKFYTDLSDRQKDKLFSIIREFRFRLGDICNQIQ